MPDIIRLRSRLLASGAVERLIAHVAEESIPFGYHGILASRTELTLKDAIDVSEARWDIRQVPFGETSDFRLLIEAKWTQETSSAISSFISRSSQAQSIFEEFLVKRAQKDQTRIILLAPALLAYFTSVSTVGISEDLTKSIFEEVAREFFHGSSTEINRTTLVPCITSIIERGTSSGNYFFGFLCKEVSILRTDQPALETARMVRTVSRLYGDSTHSLVEATTHHALGWCVRYLSGNESTIDDLPLEEIRELGHISS